MRVSHVAVDDFRSYRHAVVTLPPGPTVLVGRNGQGKTNLVEAIAYLSAFSSHRVSAESALVRVPGLGEQKPAGAVIRVKVVTGEPDAAREQVIELEIVQGHPNRARINRTQVPPKDIVGMIQTVVFAPEDLQLVRGEPALRRSFMDTLATQMRPTVAAIKSDFEAVARQRGALMKSASARLRRGIEPDKASVDVWDEQFASLSAELTAARATVVEQLADPVVKAYRDVADSPLELGIRLNASVAQVRLAVPDQGHDEPTVDDLADVDAQKERLLTVLRQVRSRDMERGVNTVGAHRDDLVLTLGHLPVKGYASHGESWSTALALRLGSFRLLERGGEEPILILDDVFAELDQSRRESLARLVSGADQVIVTAAVPEDIPSGLDGHRLWVTMEADTGTTISDHASDDTDQLMKAASSVDQVVS